jgi:hypothetical protein
MTMQHDLPNDERRSPDRRPIRVDHLPDQAGLAAMLRRAFAAGDQRDSDSEFADLLARLH